MAYGQRRHEFVYKRDCREVVWMEALVAGSSFIPCKKAALTCEQKYLRSSCQFLNLSCHYH